MAQKLFYRNWSCKLCNGINSCSQILFSIKLCKNLPNEGRYISFVLEGAGMYSMFCRSFMSLKPDCRALIRKHS